MQTLDELIAVAPVFAGLDPAWLELIAGCAVNERFPEDALLFRQGEPAERFFLIREGSVALELHAPGRGPLVIETLGPREVAGWSWLFEPHRWAFDGRAVEPTAVIAFDGRCLRGKCDADPALGYALMRRFAATIVDRLQATRLQLLDVYANPAAR
jgi:CRP-like cAMP-binding protein